MNIFALVLAVVVSFMPVASASVAAASVSSDVEKVSVAIVTVEGAAGILA